MSDTHEEAHTGPIKNPKQLLVTVIAAFVIPVFIIIGLVYFVTSKDKPAPGNGNPEKALAERIQKVGSVEIRDANRPLRNGDEVYKVQCAACHGTGAAGAPKFEDAAAWAPRLKQGFEALVHSALTGKGAMAPQGGGDFNDIEIARGVAYMANAAGGKFPIPDKPAADGAAAPASAAEAAPAAAPASAAEVSTPAAAVAAPAPVAAVSADAGKALYDKACFVCHAAGVAGAPKFGDKNAWAPYVATGIDAMVKVAISGKGAMPPKGGSTASDDEIRAAVQYMVDHAK
ncbi:cytochrome c5 family protein [Diaphorobacter sp. HDW4A]|uniref:c-type cytochrome n=1 Tax=Diaphorobacter sp. HDW4A TaxID=2714924 RepID=UPI00140B3F83|nr:c-type cytochrome [Diaphorobacter sp. HDW4A]QIL82171.1 cytochrome c5 family protein [Diaphorobacter sp. HDW4A]